MPEQHGSDSWKDYRRIYKIYTDLVAVKRCGDVRSIGKRFTKLQCWWEESLQKSKGRVVDNTSFASSVRSSAELVLISDGVINSLNEIGRRLVQVALV